MKVGELRVVNYAKGGDGLYYKPTDVSMSPQDKTIAEVTKKKAAQKDLESSGVKEAGTFARAAVVHSPTIAWEAMQISFGMGGVDEFPEVIPTGLPLVDDRALMGFRHFAKIVSLVNSWRYKRISFLKAAARLAGKEVNMRGAVFEVIKGVHKEILSQFSAFESKWKAPDGRPLQLEVSFDYDEASLGGESHSDMHIAPLWDMTPGLKAMVNASADAVDVVAPSSLSEALKALGEYLGAFSVVEAIRERAEAANREHVQKGEELEPEGPVGELSDLESLCWVDNLIDSTCTQMSDLLRNMEREAEMLTWEGDPSKTNPLDALPEDCLEFLARKVDKSKSMATSANIFKRFEGVDTPESLAPAALEAAAREEAFYGSHEYDLFLEQLDKKTGLPLESIDALGKTSPKGKEADNNEQQAEVVMDDLKGKRAEMVKANLPKADIDKVNDAMDKIKQAKLYFEQYSGMSMNQVSSAVKGFAKSAIKQGLKEAGSNMFAGSNPVTGVLLGIKKSYQMGKAMYKVANRRFKAKKAQALAALGKAKKKLQRSIVAAAAFHNYKEIQGFLNAAASFPKQMKADFQSFCGICREDRRMNDLKQTIKMMTVRSNDAKRDERETRAKERQAKLDEGEEVPYAPDDYKVHLKVTLDADLKVLFQAISTASGDEMLEAAAARSEGV